MNLYNYSIFYRINKCIREHCILPQMRAKLRHKDMTILCNNCTGGIVSHELGLRFNSPTVNLYFQGNDFFIFLEDLKYYLEQPLELLKMQNQGGAVYPVCTLGEDKKKIILHFLHYKSFKEAESCWCRRKTRVNFEDIYVIWTFFDKTDIELLNRFDSLPYDRKVAFTENDYNYVKSAYWLKGRPNGLGVISTYINLWGGKFMDKFDFVEWFNTGQIKK